MGFPLSTKRKGVRKSYFNGPSNEEHFIRTVGNIRHDSVVHKADRSSKTRTSHWHLLPAAD